MPKRLAVFSLALLLCGAAVTAIAMDAATAQPRGANNPVLLAQNNAAPPANAARGAGRPAPIQAQRAMRRGEACQEIAARAAGRFAALEVRLDLTPAQTGAFNRWRDQRLATAKRMAADCAAQPGEARGRGRGGPASAATPPSPVERLARQETRLQRRLADIQAERPALEALYTSLNAEQRQTLARERGRGPGRMGMGRPGMGGNRMFRRGGPGMMERGPMGMERPMGRGPGNAPPPPPSQFPQ